MSPLLDFNPVLQVWRLVGAFGVVRTVRKRRSVEACVPQSPRNNARIARREQIYCPIGRASQEVRSRFPWQSAVPLGEVANGQEEEKDAGYSREDHQAC